MNVKVSPAAKRAYNLREKTAYHVYRETHDPVKGGQKGFRRLMRSRPVAQRPLGLLGPRQRAKRETSLRVLGRSRRFNEPLSKAAREAHTSPSTVRRYLGRSGYRKVGSRWAHTQRDTLVRVMGSFEKGRRVRVAVSDSKTASLLGRYARDVRTFFTDPARDFHVLEQRKGIRYHDAEGSVHTFETDPYALKHAVEASEEEFGAFDIYPEGGEDEAAFADA